MRELDGARRDEVGGECVRKGDIVGPAELHQMVDVVKVRERIYPGAAGFCPCHIWHK